MYIQMNESEEESPSIPEKNSFVEQVTLELLMNKSQYHKYVSKNNPEEFGAIQTQHKDVDTYKDSILELTEELLTNKYKNVNTEVNELFDGYVKAVVNYFKMKEIEMNNEYNKDSDEVDTLFENINDEKEPATTYNSLWGKSIIKRDKH